jgi:TonB family protein
MAELLPRAQYPYEARSRHIQGSGIFVLHVHGDVVTKVDTYRSTGSPILDNAALSGITRWRFKPNTPVLVVVPITYVMVGGNGNVRLPQWSEAISATAMTEPHSLMPAVSQLFLVRLTSLHCPRV